MNELELARVIQIVDLVERGFVSIKNLSRDYWCKHSSKKFLVSCDHPKLKKPINELFTEYEALHASRLFIKLIEKYS
ncbi:MAG: hypothetical protein ACFFG0_27370 [Candidatus Thorarchaeota archaeon]